MGLELAPFANTRVNTFFGVPEGFLAHKKVATARLQEAVAACSVACATIEKGQTRRWSESTGLDPAESAFTLVIPVHNEEQALPSFLSSLLSADLPSSVPAEIVFVSNGSTDASDAIIEDFFLTMGPAATNRLKADRALLSDKGLAEEYTTQTLGALKFSHLRTTTLGKANALNIGNERARNLSHRVILSMDSDAYIEGDAIRILFGRAYDSIVRSPDGTAVLFGEPHRELKNGYSSKVLQQVDKLRKEVSLDPSVVSGHLMAWDTEFVENHGGVPQVAVEDYALGVLARANGRTLQPVSEAHIWHFQSATWRERMSERTRYMRGKLQIQGRSDEEKAIVVGDNPALMGDVPTRLRTLIVAMKDKPGTIPVTILRAALREYTRVAARRALKKDPKNQSWEQITSTR